MPEPQPGFTRNEKIWIAAMAGASFAFFLVMLHGGIGNSAYDWLLLSAVLLNGFSIFSFYARRSVRRSEHRLKEHRRQRDADHG